jgi:predicted transcriptional regulator
MADERSEPERKHLGALELAILEVLWSREEATVRDVLNVLNRSRSLAYTTVLTVMNRLWEKGLLVRRLVGRGHVYRAAVTREEFRRDISRKQVRRLVEDFGDLALAHFAAELERVDPARLEALRKLVTGSREGGPA